MWVIGGMVYSRSYTMPVVRVQGSHLEMCNFTKSNRQDLLQVRQVAIQNHQQEGAGGINISTPLSALLKISSQGWPLVDTNWKLEAEGTIVLFIG